ncbi:MAG: YdjY domain-containing protein [Thermoguttaceae bacterium]
MKRSRSTSLIAIVALALFVLSLPTQGFAEPPQRVRVFKPILDEPRQEASPDLGQPLVENADKLTRLDPKHAVWVDKPGRQVVLVGAVCKTFGPLELFACLVGTKEYESIVAVPTTARLVQTALLAVGAETGHPVQYEPQYAPPRGTPVEITVIWTDKEGHRQSTRAQEWVRKVGTTQSMEQAWVLAGGRFWKDEQSGKEIFTADVTGDLICVSNFDDAVLDVPLRSTTEDASLLFEAFAERIPQRGTPVTLLLKPQLKEPQK